METETLPDHDDDRFAGLDDEIEDEDAAAEIEDELDEDYVVEVDDDLPETKPMKIFGDVYQLKTMDHLSPDEESQVSATFARFLSIYQRLATAKTDQKAKVEAARLRKLRIKLILLMTTIPRRVVERMGPGGQGKVLAAIQEEIGAEADDDVGDVDLEV